MRLIHDLDAVTSSERGAILSIGKFDGLHAGHAEILRTLVGQARRQGVCSAVFTFDPAPVEILRPAFAVPPLCTLARKIELIESFGPDLLVVFPTTRAFLELSADEFFRRVVLDAFAATGMVEGKDFNFGSNRSGNCDRLRTLCSNHALSLDVVSPICALGREVSSSRIRALLREGEIAAARAMLTRPYRMTGCVVHGEHRGRRLGFPTANLSGVKTILPKTGVYAARAVLEQGVFPAALNIGGNPTFGVSAVKIEAHLLDFSGDLYGQTVSLDLYSRLRDLISFDSEQALIDQMRKDFLAVRSVK